MHRDILESSQYFLVRRHRFFRGGFGFHAVQLCGFLGRTKCFNLREHRGGFGKCLSQLLQSVAQRRSFRIQRRVRSRELGLRFRHLAFDSRRLGRNFLFELFHFHALGRDEHLVLNLVLGVLFVFFLCHAQLLCQLVAFLPQPRHSKLHLLLLLFEFQLRGIDARLDLTESLLRHEILVLHLRSHRVNL